MSKKRNIKLEILGVFAFFATWQLVNYFGLISTLYISSPLIILENLINMFWSGDIFPHMLVSGEAFLTGLLLAIFFGVSLGLIFGWENRIFSLFKPLIYAFYSTPYVALIPLFVIWLGLGIWIKVAIVFMGGFFPIIVNTIAAVEGVDPNYLKLSKVFGGSSLDTIRRIILPASVPVIAAGLKQAVPRAIVGLVAAEFFASSAGLGFLIATYGSILDTGKILAVVIILIAGGLILTSTVEYFEDKYQAWKL